MDPGIVDEEPLRQWVLKAYHEKRFEPGQARDALAAVRQFLSGPPGGDCSPGRYWFEDDPPASVRSFMEDMERVKPGLSRSVLEPLLNACKDRERSGGAEPIPNPSLFISSLAGAVAVKTGIDETPACALLAAAMIGISRLGTRPLAEALEGP